MVKGNFPKKRKSVIYEEKKFSGKNIFDHFLEHIALYLSAKNQKKTNEAILHKVQKTLFLGGFWPKFAQKIFFLKIGLRHFLDIAILHLCAKNQQKLMSQSREKQENRKMVKGNFPKKRISVIYDEKKFSGKTCFGHFLEHLALYLSAKNQKKLMKQFCTKSKKPY